MRDDDLKEFLALSTAETRDELAHQMAERFNRPDVMVAFIGDEPVAVGALIETRPNVLTVLFFATDRFPQVANRLTAFIKKRLLPRMQAAGAHRIECVSHIDHAEAHRWIIFMGLRPEGPPMRGYGKNGEAYQQFAWVSDACAAGS